MKMFIWLVVLTIMKNMSQWEGLSHILWKKNMFETTNQSLFSGYPKSMNRLQEVHYREDGHLLR
jgi:hypothetical protein